MPRSAPLHRLIPACFLPVVRNSLATLLLVLGLGLSASAQPEPSPTCTESLDEATAQYVAQDYVAVEPLVNDCLYLAEARPPELQRAYRLLALSFIRQNMLAEAQTTIIKLLGTDYAYEPDPVLDPPVYVSLVNAIKDQLRVGTPEDAATDLVDINTASVEQFEALRGVGPVLAERIVAYRRANGAFQRIEDIQNVRGIGARTFENLAPHLTVDPASTTYSAAGGRVDPPLPTRETNHPAESGSVGDSSMEAVPLLININTATAAELEQLSGVGPVLAGRIIAYRESAGGFRSVEELIEVRGIGPRTLERLAPFVTIASDEDD